MTLTALILAAYGAILARKRTKTSGIRLTLAIKTEFHACRLKF